MRHNPRRHLPLWTNSLVHRTQSGKGINISSILPRYSHLSNSGVLTFPSFNVNRCSPRKTLAHLGTCMHFSAIPVMTMQLIYWKVQSMFHSIAELPRRSIQYGVGGRWSEDASVPCRASVIRCCGGMREGCRVGREGGGVHWL